MSNVKNKSGHQLDMQAILIKLLQFLIVMWAHHNMVMQLLICTQSSNMKSQEQSFCYSTLVVQTQSKYKFIIVCARHCMKTFAGYVLSFYQ